MIPDRGRLGDHPLPTLLHHLHETAATGTLHLATRTGRHDVFIRAGYPVSVSLPGSAELLGKVLLEMGMLDEATYRQTLIQPPPPGQRYGEMLLEKRLVTSDQMRLALKAQVRRKLHRLFFVNDGDYSFDPGEHQQGMQQRESLRVHPFRAIYHGVRSAWNAERLSGALCLLEGRAIQCPLSAEDVARYGTGPDDGRVAELLRRGFWTLPDLVEAGGLPVQPVHALVYAFYITGALNVKNADEVARLRRRDAAGPAAPTSDAAAPTRDAQVPAQPAPTHTTPAPAQATPTPVPSHSPQAPSRSSQALPQNAQVPSHSPPAPAHAAALPKSSAQPQATPSPSAPAPSRPTPIPRSPSPPSGNPVVPSPRELTAMQQPTPAPLRNPSGSYAKPLPTGFPPSSVATPTPLRNPSGSYATVRNPSGSHATVRNPSGSYASPTAHANGSEVRGVTAETAAAATHELQLVRRQVESKARVVDTENLFEVLGLPTTAGRDEIKNAYFEAAKRFHPDRLSSLAMDSLRPDLEKIFRRVTEAYNTLFDEKRREEYRATLSQPSGADSDAHQRAVRMLEAEMAFRRGEIQLRKNDYAGAIREFESAVLGNPEEGEHLAYLTWARVCAGHITHAEGKPKLVEATRMSPKCARAFYFLGVCLKEGNEIDRAAGMFRKAAELDGRLLDAERELRLINMRKEKGGDKKGLFDRWRKPTK